MRRLLTFAFVVLTCLAVPGVVEAQSAIAGIVRDTTGAVLPGVTVEVSSPALIEKTRTAVTDAAGQYRIVDLRPGTYSVTFALPGFTTVRREGIVLEANFTAPVNAEMRLGALEETVTVTGESPIVDVQNTLRRDVVNRELLETLPTGRDFQTIGNVLPSVNMGRFDVAGSSTVQSGTLVAFGSRGGDFQLQVDGMSASITFGEGWFNGMYHNEAVFEEMSFTLSGGNAETQSGGITVNMIPRSGGNEFRVEGLGTFTNHDFQSRNIDDRLLSTGFRPTAGGLDKMWDVNGSVGGPIKRDRLWFFTSARHWGFSENVPNVFWKDGRQAFDDTKLKAANLRLTTQLGNTRVTGSYDHAPRWRRHFGIELRGGSPESFSQYPNESWIYQAKATSTLTSRLLVEAGFTRVWWWSQLLPQPGTRMATCTVAFRLCPPGTDYGDIRKQDLALGWNFNAPINPNSEFEAPRNTTMASLSYVTGSHNLKVGYTHSWGYRLITTPQNNGGGIVQRYRLGVPDSVQL
ncbi:MAG TPA: carboxypeptidase-like regulatory domain-containing protein, partial [Vicinamibacterales bacterium]|nr:carboxypeptidase-like regulatory domain-containing protein [Vicinamibacterales bacterium]